mgnify:CR=1 FL=1
MDFEIEKAKIMLKLVRKGNWNNSYDREEHFKRFENLDNSIKELQKKGWVILHRKPKFEAYSLNTEYKSEIIDFIENYIPEVRGTIR